MEKQLADDPIRSHDVHSELFISCLLMLYFVTIKILIPIFHTPLPIYTRLLYNDLYKVFQS